MKKTDIDIKMFEEQLSRVSENIKKQKNAPCCGTFYINVSGDQQGIREYDFRTAAAFRKMLEERVSCGNRIFRQFDAVCTASLFKYYNCRPEDTEHREVSDFTYEF